MLFRDRNTSSKSIGVHNLNNYYFPSAVNDSVIHIGYVKCLQLKMTKIKQINIL